ncbi:abortive infection family protein [Burkholderia gladioli]|uniref:abortive infection family protein n=1 Tax=Burkholderia gladioli TaxID=28095 RepID=UPI00163ED62D|nr:abortive infection family protein [Burkholderia gladioli]
MRDLIKAKAAQAKRVFDKEARLRDNLIDLSNRLSEEFNGFPLSGRSSSVLVDGGAHRPSVEAFLLYDGKGLAVAARESGHRPTFPDFERMLIRDCPATWIEPLLARAVVASLVESMVSDDEFNAHETVLDSALSATRAVLAGEANAIDTEMITNLAALADETLSSLWRQAVEATDLDAADALTRCSRFLEAVCAKILRERGVALPKDKSMSPLVKACLETLTWPAEKEAEGDVRQLLGGIQSITNGIGALRTHFGTAHGATSHLPPLDRGYAVFVKQATVAAATFLLDRHQASPLAVDDSSPAPAA